jgi:Uma2 family endonuclease
MDTDQEVYVTEIARLFPPQGKWTEEDYFNLPESVYTIELLDGVLRIYPPASSAHQQACGALLVAVMRYKLMCSCGTVMHRMPVRLKKGRIRQPDILFLREEHADRQEEHICGIPDWIAEVIDESSRLSDEVTKLREYAEAGIPELWLIDPAHRSIRVYTLPHEALEYTLAATYAASQTARSVALFDLAIPVDDIIAE